MSFQPPYAPGPRLENRLAVACVLAGLVLAAIVVVKILLPWLVGAGAIGLAIWFWHRHQEQHRALHKLFYEQLEVRQGRISVLEFAMVAQLTGAEARNFLDARAREFFANFEPLETGDILYTFHIPQGQTSAATVTLSTHGDDVSAPAASSRPSPDSSESKSPLRLTPCELARRLGSSEAEMAARHNAPDFGQWSRQKDPDGCGWAYDAGCDCYSPLTQDR